MMKFHRLCTVTLCVVLLANCGSEDDLFLSQYSAEYDGLEGAKIDIFKFKCEKEGDSVPLLPYDTWIFLNSYEIQISTPGDHETGEETGNRVWERLKLIADASELSFDPDSIGTRCTIDLGFINPDDKPEIYESFEEATLDGAKPLWPIDEILLVFVNAISDDDDDK